MGYWGKMDYLGQWVTGVKCIKKQINWVFGVKCVFGVIWFIVVNWITVVRRVNGVKWFIAVK